MRGSSFRSPHPSFPLIEGMLEAVRRRLSGLVQFIEVQRRRPVYTDFENQTGPESVVVIGGLQGGTDYARFRHKARAFLRAHEDHIAIQKLRTNVALTQTDLDELERVRALTCGGWTARP